MKKFANAGVSGIKWGIALYICMMLYAIHVQLEAISKFNYIQAEVLVTFYEKSLQSKEKRY